MIKKLKKKFIIASAISVFSVITIISAVITIFNINRLNKTIDALSNDVIQIEVDKQDHPPFIGRFPDESKEGTRFFISTYDEVKDILRVDLNRVSTIDESTALSYTNKVLSLNKNKGWIDTFRYNVYTDNDYKIIVFTDGAVNKMITTSQIISSLIILYSSGIIIFILLFIFSNKIVKPIALTYEKQKEFITDINHELKTPLTLLNANLDIIENENGKNEWVDDMRDEVSRMNELISKLVMLSKLDEKENYHETFVETNISKIISSCSEEFKALAIKKKIKISTNIEENILYKCNEDLIQRLIGILLDNAVKYCDQDGEIKINLRKEKNIFLEVVNTYKNVDNIKLDNLFDRFYREEKSRTTKGSYGIGLSIAKMICEKHNGNIVAEKQDNYIIFKVILK